jgi:hypothetical protein
MRQNVEAHRLRDAFQVREIAPGFGWNFLSLGGSGDTAPVDRRRMRPGHLPPAALPRPKPARMVLNSNSAMARKLAEHALKPWWLAAEEDPDHAWVTHRSR